MLLGPDTLAFLAALAENNNRDWFTPRKGEYNALVRQPLMELIEQLNQQLQCFAPAFVTLPQKAVFRLYRDTRFSKDKRPFKTNAAALFWRRELPKNSSACLYVSISARETMIAGGVYMPGPPETLAIRGQIDMHHERLETLLKNRRLRARFGGLQGESLARAPKGFAPDHPAIDLLKRKDWVLWTTEPGEACLDPKFSQQVAQGFRLLAPFTEFLNEPLLARAKRPRDPLAAR